MRAHRSINRRSKSISKITRNSSKWWIEVKNPSPTISNELLTNVLLTKNSFHYPFRPLFWSLTGQKKHSSRKGFKKFNKNCISSKKGETTSIECSVILKYQLEMVGINIRLLLINMATFMWIQFSTALFIDRCAHIWVIVIETWISDRARWLEGPHFAFIYYLQSSICSKTLF